MVTKSKQLQVLDTERTVVRLNLEGKNKFEIAEIMGLNHQTVDRYLKKALELAKQEFINDGERLLAKSYGRLEMLIERLWHEAFVEGNMAAIDRINKLVNTQSLMLSRVSGLKIQIEGNPDKPIHTVFHQGSADYELAKRLVEEDPDIVIEDPTEKFKQLAASEGYDIDISDYSFVDGEIEND